MVARLCMRANETRLVVPGLLYARARDTELLFRPTIGSDAPPDPPRAMHDVTEYPYGTEYCSMIILSYAIKQTLRGRRRAVSVGIRHCEQHYSSVLLCTRPMDSPWWRYPNSRSGAIDWHDSLISAE